MTLDPSLTTIPAPAPSAAAPPACPPIGPETAQRRAKYRLRFRKAGRLRLVSHHDLMHCVERMLRRAELPLCTTQGFHPQPRMIFAQSLALGVVGSAEVLELEMSQVLDAQDVHRRLVQQAPSGLEILHTQAIQPKASAQVRRAFYRLEVPPENSPGLTERVAELLARTEVLVERSRPRPRRFDLRPYLHRLTFHPPALEMALWVTPNGTARPDEVARLLGLEALLQEGAYFDRFNLELVDEVSADDKESLPAVLLLRPSVPVETAAGPAERSEPKTAAAGHTTLIAGPMSFDS